MPGLIEPPISKIYDQLRFGQRYQFSKMASEWVAADSHQPIRSRILNFCQWTRILTWNLYHWNGLLNCQHKFYTLSSESEPNLCFAIINIYQISIWLFPPKSNTLFLQELLAPGNELHQIYKNIGFPEQYGKYFITKSVEYVFNWKLPNCHPHPTPKQHHWGPFYQN